MEIIIHKINKIKELKKIPKNLVQKLMYVHLIQN